MEFEHEAASVLLWQRDVDPLLKPAQSVTEHSQHQNAAAGTLQNLPLTAS